MSSPPYRELPRYCQKHTSPQITFHYHIPSFHGFSVPYTSERLPYTSGALHVNSPHTPARLFPYAGAVPSYISTDPTIPYACADPHRFSWLTIHFHGPYIQLPSSKNPTPISAKPAFPASQTRHPQASANSLRRLLARYRMSRRGTNPPGPATGSRRSTHQSGLLKFHGPTTGGHGRLRRRYVGIDVRGANACHGSAWGRIVRPA